MRAPERAIGASRERSYALHCERGASVSRRRRCIAMRLSLSERLARSVGIVAKVSCWLEADEIEIEIWIWIWICSGEGKHWERRSSRRQR